MNDYDIYKNEYGGTIKIFRLCFQSQPCQHYISINNKQIVKISSDIICKFLKEYDYDVPDHFHIWDKDFF
jgi:hypothetical protein